jgi:hypothetical protein
MTDKLLEAAKGYDTADVIGVAFNKIVNKKLEAARQNIESALRYFNDTDCFELKEPTPDCPTCLVITNLREALSKLSGETK